ncbi:hypothetical protein SERLA73DRAFT_184848, partial [Serpula lacrymans var. lacrymans S7.3]
MDRVSETSDKLSCGICRRQFSRYTCPTCNIPYCSLTCFRSEVHSQCSETFYRREIESGIKSESSRTAEERAKMMELLRRFEEQSSRDDLVPMPDETDGDEDTGLAERLQNLDIMSTSSDTLWSFLNKEERSNFMKVLADPSGDLAQKLLASKELKEDKREPWWEANTLDPNTFTSSGRYGHKPKAITVPASMAEPNFHGPPLRYNVCAILIAYAYVTRHLSASPLSSVDPEDSNFCETRRIISNLIPFLVDPRARVLYTSLSEVVTAVWSRFQAGEMNSKFFSVLLRDVANIVRPCKIATLPSTPHMKDNGGSTCARDVQIDGHPNLTSVLALSDIAGLFQDSDKSKPAAEAVFGALAPRQNHITLKLTYYAARQLATAPAVLQELADEIIARSKVIDDEYILSGVDGANPRMDCAKSVPKSDGAGPRDQKTRAKIEEMS